MRDPHVQAMYYEVSSEEGISYRNPQPVSFTNHLGTFDLRGGKLHILPSEHFADEDDARRTVEIFLRAWEIEADLTASIGTIRFKFDRAEVIDRDPPPPGLSRVIEARAGSIALAGNSILAHVIRTKYPQPPKTFRATPEAQHAYRRWLGYRLGKEPLQSMAYFILTLLESAAGGRQNAARSFQIDVEILRTIGRLSSMKGDENTARKANPCNQFQELSGTEQQWLEEAIRRIILRLGEHASGAPLAVISLQDLPTL